MLRLYSNIYNLLLYLYPAGFRAKFGDEMRIVFNYTTTEARGYGWLPLVVVLIRELLDLPHCLLSEYRLVFQRREARMSNWVGLDNLLDEQFDIDEDAQPPATWKEMILVAVPFILPTLFLSIPQLLVVTGLASWESRFLSNLQTILGVSIVLFLLGGLIIAWRAKWPRWSASWYLFFGALIISPLLYLASLFEDVSRAADVFSEFAAFFLLPVVIAWFLYRVTRLDPIKGLLAVLPLLVLIWTLNMEFVPDQIEAPITMASFIIAALAAAALLRLSNWRIGLWLVILVIALIGLLYSYAGIYHGGSLPFSVPYPNPEEVLKNFMPQFLAVSTLVLGPLLAVSFRSIGLHSGLRGLISYRFVLLGMLFILASMMANFFLVSDSRVSDLRETGYFWLNLMFICGLLCYLAAVLILGQAFLRQQPMRAWLEYSLLSLLTLMLPVVLMMPLMGMINPNINELAGFGWIYSLPLTLIALLGFAWLLLAGWLVTHHNQRNGSHGEVQTA
jgi:hypothetical protein